MSAKPNPHIVVIGGGTGSFNLLRRLKEYTSDITALVTMFDNGGSTGQLRDEYGVLPPGDVRQCLVALSNAPKIRDLFNYRFDTGSFDGHNFGNLFLGAVEKMTDDFGQAVELAGQILSITGRVVPITLDHAELVLIDGDHEIVGEQQIEKYRLTAGQHPGVRLQPYAKANPKALQAILTADIIVIAPGSLYESLIPHFLVEGVTEALAKTTAKVVQVVNLVTKPGQTDDWSVSDFVDEIERFAGKDIIDYALYNTQRPTPGMLKQYAHDGEYPVTYDQKQLDAHHCRSIGGQLIHVYKGGINPRDKLAIERTLIRHDADKIARELMRIYFS